MKIFLPARLHAAARAAIAVSASLVGSLVLTGCHHTVRVAYRYPPPPPTRTSPTPASGSSTPTRPVASVPRADVDDDTTRDAAKTKLSETVTASWYGPPYNRRQGANGEIYDQNAMTAAHRTLPMGTVVRVTNLTTGQSATVKITDRGPFVRGRGIDLSLAAAKATGVYRMGVASVRMDVVQQRAGAGAGKWCVQVGAFLEGKHAEHLRDDLLRRYSTSAKVIEFKGPTGHWVRINPLATDRGHATQIADAIRPSEPGAQAWLVRLD